MRSCRDLKGRKKTGSRHSEGGMQMESPEKFRPFGLGYRDGRIQNERIIPVDSFMMLACRKPAQSLLKSLCAIFVAKINLNRSNSGIVALETMNRLVAL
jgi:hypothetical protein